LDRKEADKEETLNGKIAIGVPRTVANVRWWELDRQLVVGRTLENFRPWLEVGDLGQLVQKTSRKLHQEGMIERKLGESFDIIFTLHAATLGKNT